MTESKTSICRACGSVGTIRAHIIPRAFATDAKDGDTHLISTSPERYGTSQGGYFDDFILCGTCDGRLGVYDSYAIEMCRKLKNERFRINHWVELPYDGDLLARFANAVLWRASISSHRMLTQINLGPFEDLLRSALFGNQACLPTHLTRLQTNVMEPMGFYSYPVAHRVKAYRTFSMVLGGFRWTIYADSRPLMGAVKEGVINGSATTMTAVIPFAETTDARAMIGIVRALDEKQARR